MLLKLKLLTFNVGSALLLIFFLCLGSQNISQKYSLNFLINKTVRLPVGFIIGTSFACGLISGGLTSILMLKNEINDKN